MVWKKSSKKIGNKMLSPLLRFKLFFRIEAITFFRSPQSYYIKYALNLANYLRFPRKTLRNHIIWKKNLIKINQVAKDNDFIAFSIYGFRPGNTDITLYQYLSITSFVYQNPTTPVYVFYAFDNDGFYWNKLREHAHLIQISTFEFYKCARFHHYAHKSDILRLLILNQVGGLYFDIDTMSINGMESIANSKKAILGLERNPETNEISGICNAIMWSPRGNVFTQEWIKRYRSFYSKGKDAFWGEHSIRLPLRIFDEVRFRSHVIVLPPEKLFSISWLHLCETILSSPIQNLWDPDKAPPIIHLWETLAEDDLSRITAEYIRYSDSWYALEARKIVESLSITFADSI